MSSPKNKGPSGSRYILSLRKVSSQKRIWVAGHIQSTFKGLISVLSSANAPGFPPHKIKKPDLCSNVAFALHPNTKHHEEKKLGVGRRHVYKDMHIHPTVPAESKNEALRFELGGESRRSVMILKHGGQTQTVFSAELVRKLPPYLLLGPSFMKHLPRACIWPWRRVPIRKHYFDLWYLFHLKLRSSDH